MAEAGAADVEEQGASADAVRIAAQMESSLNPAERQIYQHMGFYIAKLKVTEELIDDWHKGKHPVFNETQTQLLRDKLRQHADIAPPCTEVNKLVVDFAVQLKSREVNGFLRCLEKHQKEIPLTVLKGSTISEISSGTLEGSHTAEAVVSRSEKLEAQAYREKLSVFGVPTKRLKDYLTPDKKDLAKTNPEQSKPDHYYIGPEGGEFDFASTGICGPIPNYDIHLSVPENAVPSGQVRCNVFASRDKGKVISRSPFTYLSPAYFFEDHGLRFQKPVTVTIKLPRNYLRNCKEIRLFSSNTTGTEEPDFEDVTSECNPSFSITRDSALVKFQLNHFSIGVFLAGAAVGVLAGVAGVKLMETKTVYLEAAAPVHLRRNEKKIPLRVCVVKDSIRGKKVCPEGYRLVTMEPPAMRLPYFSYINVEVCEPGIGDCWKAESLLDEEIQCDKVCETELEWSGCLSRIPESRDGRIVLAEGDFKCTLGWDIQGLMGSNDHLVHFVITGEDCNPELPMECSDDGQSASVHMDCSEYEFADAAAAAPDPQEEYYRAEVTLSSPEAESQAHQYVIFANESQDMK